jgi:hypothetical protein
MQRLIRLASSFGKSLGFNLGNSAKKRSSVTLHASKPNCGEPQTRHRSAIGVPRRNVRPGKFVSSATPPLREPMLDAEPLHLAFDLLTELATRTALLASRHARRLAGMGAVLDLQKIWDREIGWNVVGHDALGGSL